MKIEQKGLFPTNEEIIKAARLLAKKEYFEKLHRKPSVWKKIWWFITEKSPCCGAELFIWSDKKIYCKKCGNKQ